MVVTSSDVHIKTSYLVTSPILREIDILNVLSDTVDKERERETNKPTKNDAKT